MTIAAIPEPIEHLMTLIPRDHRYFELTSRNGANQIQRTPDLLSKRLTARVMPLTLV